MHIYSIHRCLYKGILGRDQLINLGISQFSIVENAGKTHMAGTGTTPYLGVKNGMLASWYLEPK